MTVVTWIIPALAVLLAFALFCRWLLDAPRDEDVVLGLIYRFIQLYSRWFHHLRVTGLENVPRTKDPGPLVVVCNHTAGIDPLLVQSLCLFQVRWMMALDMRMSRLDWFWNWSGMIFVDRTGKDQVGMREAIRHVNDGGVVGVFPEGALERPPRHLLPFHPGVGLIVSRTGAPVLPMIIEGTPVVKQPWDSLTRQSHSSITVGPMMRFDGMKAAEISRRLREWYTVQTGWPSGVTPSTSPAFRADADLS